MHIFLAPALYGGEWPASGPGRCRSEERCLGTHWIRNCMHLRASGCRREEKFFTLPELELRPLGTPARNQSLYRLHYPGPASMHVVNDGRSGVVTNTESKSEAISVAGLGGQ
jgi:hypothetical protein